jgi:hypothetical protein
VCPARTLDQIALDLETRATVFPATYLDIVFMSQMAFVPDSQMDVDPQGAIGVESMLLDHANHDQVSNYTQ